MLQTKSTCERLADWIVHLAAQDIPVATVTAAKSCILDSLACMIGGIGLKPSRIALDVLLSSTGVGKVCIPGTSARLGVLPAAYIGAYAANALDFDDCFREDAPSHPGATIIPAALAVAADRDCDGHRFIRAVIAAYEVSLRIGRAVDASSERKASVMGYGPWQTFGATVVASALLGLDQAQIRSAFGVAGAHAPVPSIRKFVDGVRPYSWVKNGYGMASEAGVLAALLAERGFHGNQEILDGEHGFWAMAGSDRYRRELAVDGLGEDWLINKVEFKPYACCRWSHTMLEALAQLRQEQSPDDIVSVEVAGFKEFVDALDGSLPETIVDAQFNAPYLGALELLGRSPAHGLDERDLVDAGVRAMAARIRIRHDPALDEAHETRMATPVRVALRDRQGERRETFIEEPSTSVRRGGFSQTEIGNKFINIASPVLRATAAAARDMVLNLENHRINDLVPLLLA